MLTLDMFLSDITQFVDLLSKCPSRDLINNIRY